MLPQRSAQGTNEGERVLRMQMILVADDQPGIRDFLRMNLAHREYDVLVAKSGQEAVELFQRDHPPLVILDLHLSGMEGFDVLEQLYTLSPKARIYIFTGADLEAVRTRIQGGPAILRSEVRQCN